MKKILWVVVPICIVALLVGAHTVFSLGESHHMMMGGGSMEDMMLFHLQSMAKDLNLTLDQQAKLNSLKQDAENNMQQGWEKHKQLHDTIQQQLASGTFEFAQLRTLLDGQIDDHATAAHNMVARFQEFFDQLTPDQKKAMADELRQHMQHMDEMHQMWHHNSDQEQKQQPQH
jgi:periplasmic protein CpxP/Spy